jgi:hypothetical protein
MSLARQIEQTGPARVDRAAAAEIAEVIARHNPNASKSVVTSTGRLAATLAAAAAALPVARQKKLLSGKPKQDVERIVNVLLDLSSEPESDADIPVEVSKGAGFGELIDIEESRRRLAEYATPMRIEEWAGPVAGPVELERDYGISRSTLHNWQRRGAVIGLLKGERKHVFPIEQFVDGRPVEGIADVLKVIDRPRSAWLWMVQRSPLLGNKRPIDLLKQGRIEEVVEAARTVFEHP